MTSILTALVGFFCAIVVKKYHENKPLGMQTILGEVIRISLVSYGLVTANNLIIMNAMVCAAPIAAAASVVLAVANFFVAVLILTSLMLLFITKYLSLFHGPYLASLEEKDYLKVLKVLLYHFTEKIYLFSARKILHILYSNADDYLGI